MSKGKAARWISDNIVLLVGIPLIVGVHWGWTKLQEVPYLVDQSQKREMPIVAAVKGLSKKLWMKMGLTGVDNTATGKPDT